MERQHRNPRTLIHLLVTRPNLDRRPSSLLLAPGLRGRREDMDRVGGPRPGPPGGAPTRKKDKGNQHRYTLSGKHANAHDGTSRNAEPGRQDVEDLAHRLKGRSFAVNHVPGIPEQEPDPNHGRIG